MFELKRDWHIGRIAALRQLMDLVCLGTITLHEDVGHGWTDITARSLARWREEFRYHCRRLCEATKWQT
jgi:hypothetical protein